MRGAVVLDRLIADSPGWLLWWYRPDPHLVRTIAMDDRVSAVAFRPDGATLAVGLEHGIIELRTVATGVLVRRLSGHTGTVLSLAWSIDGQQLVSGAYDGTVRLWSLSEPFTETVLIQKPPIAGLIRKDKDGHEQPFHVPFYSVALSADARTIAAGSDDGQAYVVDSTGTHERQIQAGADDSFTNHVSALAFDSSGSRIAFVAADRFLVVQLDRTGAVTEQVQFARRGLDLYTIQFHEQDNSLYSFDPVGYFSSWSLTTPGAVTEVRVTYPDPFNVRQFIANSGTFSADGRLIAFGSGRNRPMFDMRIRGVRDSRVFVVRAGEATPWLTLSGHSDYVDAVAFNPQGNLLASGSSDRTVQLWRVE
jgi:WD40 repeat protein